VKRCTNIAIVGHVDHGKSTIIGRLLADTHSLPEGKLDKIKSFCKKNARPFEYAFLLDALKDEQAQGITIDIARCFFKTKHRQYLLLDTPGHIEFLKNMVTGAANADAALLVIDANEGIKENSRRHAYMLSMLNIQQVIVLVNKMDLIAYDKTIFNEIVKSYTTFLANIKLSAKMFIPVSGMKGDNIATLSSRLSWYDGMTVLQSLDQLEKPSPLINKPFRLTVQDVYKFTQGGDNRRIVAGRIESGQLSIGDVLTFYPSGKSSSVKTFEAFNEKVSNVAKAASPIGFTLTEQIYIKRGEVAVKSFDSSLHISSRFVINLFWLGIRPLQLDKEYWLKIGTAKVKMHVEKVTLVIDASTLGYQKTNNTCVKRHQVAECVIRLHTPIACDFSHENAITSRFVIVDHYNIAGGGIIQKSLSDPGEKRLHQIQKRNVLWITSHISREERTLKYQHPSAMIVVTGKKGTGRQYIAKKLERALFDLNKKVYYLGIGNIIHGVDADINRHNRKTHHEHLRRFAEVLNILLDAGHIVVVTAVELKQKEINLIKLTTNCHNVYTVWMGTPIDQSIETNMYVDEKIKDASTINNIVKDFARLHLC
jgi:bifunctional enzyme CysN/CysC